MAFSVLSWLLPKLPIVTGITWRPGWPADFAVLPRGCFRMANDAVGAITSEGEGSAQVSVYIDTWARTPELREAYDAIVIDAMNITGMIRTMKRHAEETRPDESTAYRSTLLFAGEYDHSNARMCAP